METLMIFLMLLAEGRVVHPNWNEQRRRGRIVGVPNDWHADVLFDGWDRPVRASQFNLEWEVVLDNAQASH